MYNTVVYALGLSRQSVKMSIYHLYLHKFYVNIDMIDYLTIIASLSNNGVNINKGKICINTGDNILIPINGASTTDNNQGVTTTWVSQLCGGPNINLLDSYTLVILP